ncbi:MAG: N-formylglutamate amidohydrolase [Candidatus Latescibacterota bacterium]
MEVADITGQVGSPLVVSVPHTGTLVPEEVAAQLAVPVSRVQQRVDEWAWELARTAEPWATVVRARLSRAVVDLNRSGTVSDLDLRCDLASDGDRLVRLYDEAGRLRWRAPAGEPPISREELERRLRLYHEPFHRALQGCLETAPRPCLLVDVHSMSAPGFDLVLGDFRGRSAGCRLCERRLVPFFAARGYRVGYAGPQRTDGGGRPAPPAAVRYSGGFTTARYGHPEAGQHAVQLEVSRATCRADLAQVEGDFRDFWGFVRGLLGELRQGGTG